MLIRAIKLLFTSGILVLAPNLYALAPTYTFQSGLGSDQIIGNEIFLHAMYSYTPGAGGSADKSGNTFYTIDASYAIRSLGTLKLSLSRREYDTSVGATDANVYFLD